MRLFVALIKQTRLTSRLVTVTKVVAVLSYSTRKLVNYSLKRQFIIHTTPGDDRSSCDDSGPRCCCRGIEAVLSIPPAPSPTNLPITSSDVNPHWGHRTQTVIHDFNTYRHEHYAVVRPAKLGDAVQEHSWHLLVSVFDETENLKGKTARLTLPVFKNSRLWVFVAAVSKENNLHIHVLVHTLTTTDLMPRFMFKH